MRLPLADNISADLTMMNTIKNSSRSAAFISKLPQLTPLPPLCPSQQSWKSFSRTKEAARRIYHVFDRALLSSEWTMLSVKDDCCAGDEFVVSHAMPGDWADAGEGSRRATESNFRRPRYRDPHQNALASSLTASKLNPPFSLVRSLTAFLISPARLTVLRASPADTPNAFRSTLAQNTKPFSTPYFNNIVLTTT